MNIKKKKSEITKQKILESGLKCFNRSGTRFVTTHDIANETGISPGNLYYHFKNKDEIIRDLFARMTLFSSAAWREETTQSEPESFVAFLEFFFAQIRDYRFFFREQGDLLRSDKTLAKAWKTAQQELMDVMREAAQHWVALGILNEFESRDAMEAFIENCWIIVNYAAPYFENKGIRNTELLEKLLVRQVASFLMPYHTAAGKKQIEGFFEARN